LRNELEEPIGAVEKPTSVADLELRMPPLPIIAACGTVERLDRTLNLQAIWVEPEFKAKDNPFYAKLRAEAEPSLCRPGSGKLYLGFHLDSLYEDPWTNLSKPISVPLSAPDGTDLGLKLSEGPKVYEPTDIEPCEFLIDVTNWPIETPIKVTENYSACNDEQGWCLALQRKDDLIRVRDLDAGRIQRNCGGARDRATQS
jgi:hypothetical protein